MTRGGRARADAGAERRCVATGESGPTAGLVRFALGPDGVVTPDLAERLPGRGVWVSADRAALEKAVRRNLFARGFRAPARAPEDLVAAVEQGLARRCVEAVAMARKAGLATAGFEQARARLRAGPVACLLEAADGSPAQRAKLRALAGAAPVVDRLTAAELGLAFGREFVIHAVLDAGGTADRVVREARRLAGLRGTEAGQPRVDDGGGVAGDDPA